MKKLNSASEPTATIAGTRKPKISTGSSRTPPPTPAHADEDADDKANQDFGCQQWHNRSAVYYSRSVHSDEAFALEMQNDFLSRFFG